MTVGLLSDTHLPRRGAGLPDPLRRAFDGVDLILHAGDLNELAVLVPLELIAPVVAVYGNTDPWDTCNALRETRLLRLDGLSVGLAHGHTGRGATTRDRARSHFAEAQVVVYGHSHRPEVVEADGQLIVNPGSPTDPRGAPSPSCAILVIADGRATARLVTW